MVATHAGSDFEHERRSLFAAQVIAWVKVDREGVAVAALVPDHDGVSAVDTPIGIWGGFQEHGSVSCDARVTQDLEGDVLLVLRGLARP